MPENLRNRQTIRLKGYDYSQPGWYFVTICTWQREAIFGRIAEDCVQLTVAGKVVAKTWLELPRHYPLVQVDEFIVMPNHIHGIVVIVEKTGVAPAASAPLSEIVRRLKSDSARKINLLQQTPQMPVWQRNYYEHIIRTNEELAHIRRYIAENPLRWALDQENPSNVGASKRGQ